MPSPGRAWQTPCARARRDKPACAERPGVRRLAAPADAAARRDGDPEQGCCRPELTAPPGFWAGSAGIAEPAPGPRCHRIRRSQAGQPGLAKPPATDSSLRGMLVTQTGGQHTDKWDASTHRQVSPRPSPGLVPTLHVRTDHARHQQTGATERSLLSGASRPLVGPRGVRRAGGRLSQPLRSAASIKTTLCHQPEDERSGNLS